MEVFRNALVWGFTLIFIVGILGACAQNDEIGSKFPKPNPTCETSAIKERYVIKWINGSVSTVIAKSRQEFIDNVLLPKYEEIEVAEQDQIIQVPKNIESLSQNLKIKARGGMRISHTSTTKQRRDSNFGIGSESQFFRPTTDWGQEKISAEQAWSQGIYGEGVIVAVVDSGVDLNHPQLRDAIAINNDEIPDNGIDDDGNGYIDDYKGFDFTYRSPNVIDETGHGTHVSGIIAANHSIGTVKGIAPKSKIMALDFMAPQGSSGEVVGSLGGALEAIAYAANNGANVINASWGAPQCSKTLEALIGALAEKNIIFIAAAGNEQLNISQVPVYPAAYDLPAQITVGAMSVEDFQTSFSNFGPLVHIVAPGQHIWSTVPQGTDIKNPNSNERWMSGTSMAAPFVSGQAALLMGLQNGSFNISTVKDSIFRSVVQGDYFVRTQGRIDISNSVTIMTHSLNRN